MNSALVYPNHPGAKVDGPSRDAANTVESRVEKARRIIMELLTVNANLTADESAKLMKESVLFVRPRFAELHKAGRIEPDTDAVGIEIRRKNVSGMTVTAWRRCVARTGTLGQQEMF